MRMKFRWVLAGSVVLLAVGLNSCTSSNGTNPNGGTGFMWVTTQGDQMVTSYNINLSTGAASQVGKAVATGVQPVAMVISPDAHSLFVANSQDNTISAYTVNSDGSLTSAGAPIAVPGQTPVAMAMDPSGTLLFVANQGSGTVSVFKASGASLTAATANVSGPPPCSPAANSSSFETDPNTTSFVVDTANPATLSNFSLTSNVATFTISPAISTQFLSCGKVAVSGIAAPNAFLNGVWTVSGTPTTAQLMLNIPHADVTTLTPISGTASQIIPDAGPVALAVPPGGGYLYIANQVENTVTAFPYSADTSGNITVSAQVPNSPFSAGTNPSGLAFSRCAGTTQVSTNCPTAAPPGYLFVANSGSNNISIFSACVQVTTTCPSADGTLTQIGSSPVGAGTRPVSFMVSPARDLVYAVDNGSFQVSEYKYSPATGALSGQTPASISTGSSPLTGSITQDGNWVFVPNNGGSSLSGFGVSTSGALSVGTSISLAGQPSAVLIR